MVSPDCCAVTAAGGRSTIPSAQTRDASNCFVPRRSHFLSHAPPLHKLPPKRSFCKHIPCVISSICCSHQRQRSLLSAAHSSNKVWAHIGTWYMAEIGISVDDKTFSPFVTTHKGLVLCNKKLLINRAKRPFLRRGWFDQT